VAHTIVCANLVCLHVWCYWLISFGSVGAKVVLWCGPCDSRSFASACSMLWCHEAVLEKVRVWHFSGVDDTQPWLFADLPDAEV